MTPMTSPDIEAICGGLTKAQREAVAGRIVHITKRDPLVAASILTNDGGRNWTPLGLAVRDRLIAQDHKGEGWDG